MKIYNINRVFKKKKKNNNQKNKNYNKVNQ